ncbi:MAG: hypothetical protein QOI55_2972 [Actinomycetota bacterium]|jgi:uncharacterized protein (TIGR03083 family)|nr:hypothetical protein [Actinomycetota bacterium]
MTDDSDLQGLNAYDLFDREADRLYRYFTSIDDDATWSRQSGCTAWTVRDMLGHLRADEDYFQSCAAGRVAEFMQGMGERGATDLETGNQLGVDTYAGRPAGEVIEEWRTINADTRKQFRERDGGDVDTAVGAYPARWQAFHLAQELATHADDIGVPVMADEEPARTNWRAAVDRFALMEAKSDVKVQAAGDSTRYEFDDKTGTIPNRDFVDAVGGRLAANHPIDPDVRAKLCATP